MPYDALEPDDIPLMALDGRWFGRRRPSSEWRFHRDIFESRHEVGAIVHTHSRNATALACTGRGIPAFHYMVALAGGADIRCAPYRTFGTQELSDAALGALNGRKACLLANHGVIAVGADLSAALALAGEVENLAAQYCAALGAGDVRVLDESEMRRVVEKFRTYGKQDAPGPGQLSPEPGKVRRTPGWFSAARFFESRPARDIDGAERKGCLRLSSARSYESGGAGRGAGRRSRAARRPSGGLAGARSRRWKSQSGVHRGRTGRVGLRQAGAALCSGGGAVVAHVARSGILREFLLPGRRSVSSASSFPRCITTTPICTAPSWNGCRRTSSSGTG